MTLVLVVDDVPALAEQYAYDLRRLGGYDVHVAQDGRQALERRGSEVPVIVYTGTGDFDRCIQAIRLGAYGFIDKAEPVERIVREKGRFNAVEQRADRLLEARCFGLCFRCHLGVIRVGQLSRFGELLLESLELVPHLDQRLEVVVLPAQRGHALLVPNSLRIGELSLYLRGTLNSVPEPVAETQLSVLGAAAGLPYF